MSNREPFSLDSKGNSFVFIRAGEYADAAPDGIYDKYKCRICRVEINVCNYSTYIHRDGSAVGFKIEMHPHKYLTCNEIFVQEIIE